MLYASCRLGTVLFRDELEWSGDDLATLKDKRVLIIVPGTANTGAQLERLAHEISMRNSASYDAFVMFAWPSGATGVAYLLTKLTHVPTAARYLAETIDAAQEAGARYVDLDSHSLGVPIAFEGAYRAKHPVSAIFAKAGACGRNLAKYRTLAEDGMSINVFYSPKDLIVVGLYRFWFGFSGALGAYGEKTKGGNIGTQWDVSSEIGGSHIDYRRSSIVVQAMRNEAARRAAAR